MKKLDYFIVVFLLALFSLGIMEHNSAITKDSETRIIEAIEKQNDSINAVKYLNRETIKK